MTWKGKKESKKGSIAASGEGDKAKGREKVRKAGQR